MPMTTGVSEGNKEEEKMKIFIVIALVVFILGGVVFLNIRNRKKK